jgi:gluconolactonase
MSHAGLEGLIAPDAALRQIGAGFVFTEGPVWIASEQRLLFSDIPGDSRWSWSEEGGIERVAYPTSNGNGQCLDIDGHLLVCEHRSSSVTRLRDGRREIVAFHYAGQYLNSPNDVVTRSDGSIYFTDPNFGRINDQAGEIRRQILGFQGVYRVPRDGGEIELIVDETEFEAPNGLCFSPDEWTLYVNDSLTGEIKAFETATDGTLSSARIIRSDVLTPGPGPGDCDGMVCDQLGNIWVTGPGGVWVLSPAGERIGTIETEEVVGSLTWGGADLHTLFLMTSTSVQAIDTVVGPAPLPPF